MNPPTARQAFFEESLRAALGDMDTMIRHLRDVMNQNAFYQAELARRLTIIEDAVRDIEHDTDRHQDWIYELKEGKV